MSEPTAPVSAPGTLVRPVDVFERVSLLDALRGFALCGVFVANTLTWFSGRSFLPREQARPSGCGARSPTAKRSPCVWRPGAPRIRR